MSAFDESLHPRDSGGMFEQKNHTAPDVALETASAGTDAVAELIERYSIAALNYAADGESGYEDYEDEKLALADEFHDALLREQPSAERDELIRRFNENARYAVDNIDLDKQEWKDERSYEHFEDTQCDFANDAYTYFRSRNQSADAALHDIATDAIEQHRDKPLEAYTSAAFQANAVSEHTNAHISEHLRELIDEGLRDELEEEPLLYVPAGGWKDGHREVIAATDSGARLVTISVDGSASVISRGARRSIGTVDDDVEQEEASSRARGVAREVEASVNRGEMTVGEGALAAARAGREVNPAPAHITEEMRERMHAVINSAFDDEPTLFVPSHGFTDGYADVVADDGNGTPWKFTFEPDGTLSHSYRL